jgi:TonB family protein
MNIQKIRNHSDAVILGKHKRARAWVIIVTLAWFAVSAAHAQESPKSFACAGGQYIITAEASGAHQFVLNFVNLSEYVIVVQASDFIYKGASGRFYIGQVLDQPTKTTRGETFRYSASILVNNASFKGLNILGAFREQDRIEELSVRIGSKRFYLQPLDKAQFAQFSARVEDLDLRNTDAQAAMRAAGVPEMGRLRSNDGSADWDADWQDQLLPDGVNPPRYMENPEVTPTEEARRTNTYGAVKLSATITRDGAIRDLAVVKGLGHGLDERAIEAVKTSWLFLPATRNGEVVEANVKFDVNFAPPKK